MKRGLQQTQYFLLNRKGMSCSVDKTQDSRLDINNNFKGGGGNCTMITLYYMIYFLEEIIGLPSLTKWFTKNCYAQKVVLTWDKHTGESTNVGEYKTLRSTSLSQPGLCVLLTTGNLGLLGFLQNLKCKLIMKTAVFFPNCD